MAPEWLPNGSQMAPWRPLGSPGAPKLILNYLWAHFHPFGLPKSSKMEPQFSPNFRNGFERHFVPSGGLLGPFWGRFWAHFWVLFRSSAGKADFVENVLPPTWEHYFQGSEGFKKP